MSIKSHRFLTGHQLVLILALVIMLLGPIASIPASGLLAFVLFPVAPAVAAIVLIASLTFANESTRS